MSSTNNSLKRNHNKIESSNSSIAQSPFQPHPKKSKHNGHGKRGTYNAKNPHPDCYMQQSISKQQEIKKAYPWFKVDTNAFVGHCECCRLAQKSITLARDQSLYTFASSRKNLEGHKKKEKHCGRVTSYGFY